RLVSDWRSDVCSSDLEPQFPKRGDGAKRRSLRAEVGTADKDGIDRVPDALMDARQILQCELTLRLEHFVDVVAARARGNVPLGDVADALRVLEKRSGDQRDVAESRSSAVGGHGTARCR